MRKIEPQEPSSAGAQAQYAAAVRTEALERIAELGRCAQQCEQRAALQILDAIDAEALLNAAVEYRRQQRNLLETFYPFATLLPERPRRMRIHPLAIYFALLALALGWLLWRFL
jgi:hypothetical protein